MIAYSQDRKIRDEVGYNVDKAICEAVHFAAYDCAGHTLIDTINQVITNIVHDELRAEILRPEPK